MVYFWEENNLWICFEIDEITNAEIKELKKFENLRDLGTRTSEEDNRKYHTYQIYSVNDNILQDLLNNLLEDSVNTKRSISELFKAIFRLFRCGRVAEHEKELRGDIGEILFLHFLEKNNIDWTPYYMSKKEMLFDLQTSQFNFEVKSFSNSIKNIKTSWKQFCPEDKKQRFYICVEIENTSNKKTILELLSSLKYQNAATESMYGKWETMDPESLKTITANETNKICYLSNKLLPHIDIVPNNSFVNAEVELNISHATDCKLNDKTFNTIDEFVEILENFDK